MSRFSALLPLLDICNDCQFWQKTASFAGRWEREVQGLGLAPAGTTPPAGIVENLPCLPSQSLSLSEGP